jgi:HSP20 family protein
MSNKYELANLPSALWNDPFLPTDRLFDNLISTAFPEFRKTFGIDAIQKASYPKVNILETDSEIKFVADVAGLTKDEVQISIKDNEDHTKTLTISGKKESEKKDENVRYLLRELKQSYFERSFVINNYAEYDFDGITAKHENGVLSLSIPKLEVKKTENKVKYIKVD